MSSPPDYRRPREPATSNRQLRNAFAAFGIDASNFETQSDAGSPRGSPSHHLSNAKSLPALAKPAYDSPELDEDYDDGVQPFWGYPPSQVDHNQEAETTPFQGAQHGESQIQSAATDVTSRPFTKSRRTFDAQAVYPAEACLFVANLPQNVDDVTIERDLTVFFSRYGTVFIKVKRDRRLMPYAFAQFTERTHADFALQHASGLEILGRYPRLEKCGGNLSYIIFRKDKLPVQYDDAYNIFSPYGKIAKIETLDYKVQIKLHVPPSMMVQYERFDPKRDVIKSFGHSDVFIIMLYDPKIGQDPSERTSGDRTFMEIYDKNRRSIFMGNMPAHTDERLVNKLASQCGDVASVDLRSIPDANGGAPNVYAFVEFERPNAPDEAVRQFNGTHVEGSILRVERRRTRPPRDTRSFSVSQSMRPLPLVPHLRPGRASSMAFEAVDQQNEHCSTDSTSSTLVEHETNHSRTGSVDTTAPVDHHGHHSRLGSTVATPIAQPSRLDSMVATPQPRHLGPMAATQLSQHNRSVSMAATCFGHHNRSVSMAAAPIAAPSRSVSMAVDAPINQQRNHNRMKSSDRIPTIPQNARPLPVQPEHPRRAFLSPNKMLAFGAGELDEYTPINSPDKVSGPNVTGNNVHWGQSQFIEASPENFSPAGSSPIHHEPHDTQIGSFAERLATQGSRSVSYAFSSAAQHAIDRCETAVEDKKNDDIKGHRRGPSALFPTAPALHLEVTDSDGSSSWRTIGSSEEEEGFKEKKAESRTKLRRGCLSEQNLKRNELAYKEVNKDHKSEENLKVKKRVSFKSETSIIYHSPESSNQTSIHQASSPSSYVGPQLQAQMMTPALPPPPGGLVYVAVPESVATQLSNAHFYGYPSHQHEAQYQAPHRVYQNHPQAHYQVHNQVHNQTFYGESAGAMYRAQPQVPFGESVQTPYYGYTRPAYDDRTVRYQNPRVQYRRSQLGDPQGNPYASYAPAESPHQRRQRVEAERYRRYNA
ncbi:unnamed protein product [Fusarium graminearum]|nr:unnamed protein product [Fusarium graminearum]